MLALPFSIFVPVLQSIVFVISIADIVVGGYNNVVRIARACLFFYEVMASTLGLGFDRPRRYDNTMYVTC